MAERPILFSAPMVRAILAGTKTQTRRVLRDQPCELLDFNRGGLSIRVRGAVYQAFHPKFPPVRCPYGRPGDRLWVRETFRKIDGQTRPWIETDYRATYTHGDRLGDSLGVKMPWTPAIHMPRAASRITLEVTGVRVERLQDIGRADAIAEGIERIGGATSCTPWKNYGLKPGAPHVMNCASPVTSYATLWASINGDGSWDANPWVWVVEFKRVGAA